MSPQHGLKDRLRAERCQCPGRPCDGREAPLNLSPDTTPGNEVSRLGDERPDRFNPRAKWDASPSRFVSRSRRPRAPDRPGQANLIPAETDMV